MILYNTYSGHISPPRSHRAKVARAKKVLSRQGFARVLDPVGEYLLRGVYTVGAEVDEGKLWRVTCREPLRRGRLAGEVLTLPRSSATTPNPSPSDKAGRAVWGISDSVRDIGLLRCLSLVRARGGNYWYSNE